MRFVIPLIILFFGFFTPDGTISRSTTTHWGTAVPQSAAGSIAIVGDLQRTSIWELVMGREQNDYERDQIMKSIAIENPAMTVLLGDMVFDGSSTNQWDYFDSLVAPLRQKNIPLYPVVGNHEYWGKRKNNLQLLEKRFPFIKEKSWYAVTHDSLALIFLNSNELEIGPVQWKEQIAWYENRLYHFEVNSAIKAVVVFTHHPPYTNSTITGDERHVQTAFLTAFKKSHKTAAFVSGHAHTYERFRIDDKMFIISGGGGGPRVNLRFGQDCHTDLCEDDSPVRPFNYLLLSRIEGGVEIKVQALKKNTAEFYVLEKFIIPIVKEEVYSGLE